MRNAIVAAFMCVLTAVAHGGEGKTHARAVDAEVIAALWRKVVPEIEEHYGRTGLSVRNMPDLAASLASLVGLQLPDFESDGPEAVLALTAAGGEPVYGITCRRGPDGDGDFVILGYDGRVRGRSFRLTSGDYLRVRADEALGDTLWVSVLYGSGEGEYEVQVDGKGIVPLGFALGEPDEWDNSVLLTYASADAAGTWKENVPFVPQGDTALLLASPSVGDILRGLYNVENEDPREVRRAIPFLAHEDSRVRARAAAILANDPVACSAVLPLRGDAIPRVAITAHFAALSCAQVDEARTSFIHLLKSPLLYHCRHSRVGFERLRDPRVANALFRLVDANLCPDGYVCDFPGGLPDYIDALRKDDLAPNVAPLLRIWNNLRTRSDEPLDSVECAILRSLVRTEDPATDALVVRYLKAGKVDRGAPLSDVLGELAKRASALPQAIAALTKIAQKAPIEECALATLVLLAWRVEEGFQGMPDRLFDLYGRSDFGYRLPGEDWPDRGRQLGATWCRAFTLEQKRLLVNEAIARPDLLAEHVAALLSFGEPGELDDLAPGLLQIWDRMIPEDPAFEALTETLVRRRTADIDTHMAAACKFPGSPRVSATLFCWLKFRRDTPIAGAIAPLEGLISCTTWSSPAHFERDFECPRWDAVNTERTRMKVPRASVSDVDPHLAALLLLAHWRAPEADARLVALIRREDGYPLFLPLFYLAPPLHLRVALKDVTESAWAPKENAFGPAEGPSARREEASPNAQLARGPWQETVAEIARASRESDRDAWRRDAIGARVDLLPVGEGLLTHLRDSIPDFADMPYYFLETRDANGGLSYLVCCREPESDRRYLNFVIVAADGRIVGRPFRVPSWPYENGLRAPRLHQSDIGLVSFADFSMRIDAKGVVPLGFDLGTRASSVKAARWVDCVGAKPYEDTAALLRSTDTGDSYRGLYNLEFESRDSIRLALPLLSHADAGVRARALAVLANDPELCSHALAFREDRNPHIRMQALITSIYGTDLNAARLAFLWLIRRGALPRAGYDFPWLNDPRIARAALADMPDVQFRVLAEVPLEGLSEKSWGSLLATLPTEALRPHADAILARWLLLLGGQEDPATSSAWLEALVRIGAPQTDALLVRYLRERKVAHEVPFAELLWALGGRTAPLADAVPLLEEIACGATEADGPEPAWDNVPYDWRPLATIVLQKWKVPGAFERALDCIENGMNLDDLRTAAPWGRRWCEAFDAGEKRRLFVAAEASPIVADALIGMLPWCGRPELLDLQAHALRLWRNLEGESRMLDELTCVLLGANSGDVDGYLVSDLDDSPRTSTLLFHLLRMRASRPIPEAIVGLTGLSAGGISVLDDARFYREDCKSDQSIAFTERPTRALLRGFLDLPLAAALLLVHWNVRGAEERLLGVINEEGPDCFFDIIWEIGPPPPDAQKFRVLAKNYPADCRQRIERILGPRP